MIKVLEIIKDIESTSSKKEKEAILKQNEDNQLLKKVLKFVYDTNIVTGLSKKKVQKEVSEQDFMPTDDIMEYLKINNTGSDKDIAVAQDFISKQPVELQELYTQIATKNLKIGITKSTINKAYKNEDGSQFIEDFKVMLACKYQDHQDKVKDFLLSQKLDGIRCVLEKDNGKIKLRTRQGKIIAGLTQIENDAQSLPDNLVLDGELILKNPNNLNSDDLYRETMKVFLKDGAKEDVIYHVFDMLPLHEFRKGKSTLKARDRKKDIEELIVGFNYIKAVPTLYDGQDIKQIQYWLDRMESEGKEGVMINLDEKYECKRSNKLLKVKSMQTVDLKIVGFEEGTNKYEGKLGRINVDYKGNSIGVGSGFSDKERIEIWNNQDKYLGRVCEIQFFEESSNQNDDKSSLRFPVFKQIREIEKEVSYN